jgi:hypothetical protein
MIYLGKIRDNLYFNSNFPEVYDTELKGLSSKNSDHIQ